MLARTSYAQVGDLKRKHGNDGRPSTNLLRSEFVEAEVEMKRPVASFSTRMWLEKKTLNCDSGVAATVNEFLSETASNTSERGLLWRY